MCRLPDHLNCSKPGAKIENEEISMRPYMYPLLLTAEKHRKARVSYFGPSERDERTDQIL